MESENSAQGWKPLKGMQRKKVPEILQSQMAECGLACLAMVMAYYDNPLPLSQLRQQYRISSDGVSLYQIIKIAQEHQLSSRPLELNLSDVDQLQLPAILFWNKMHFVVLEKVTTQGIEIIDPAIGRRSYSFEQASVYFSGVALELSPLTDFTPQHHEDNSVALNFSTLVRHSKGLVSKLAIMVLLTVLGNLVMIVSPKLFNITVDEVIVKNDEQLLNLLLMVFGGIFIISFAIKYLYILISTQVRVSITHETSSAIVNWLLRLPVKFFETRHIADILRRVRSADLVYIQFTAGWLNIIIDILFALVFLCLIGFINIKLTFMVVGVSLLFFVVRFGSIPWLENNQKAVLEAETRRDATLFEGVGNIESVKFYGYESAKLSRWSNQQAEAETLKAKVERTQSVIATLHSSTSDASSLIISAVGAVAVINGQNTLGELFAFVLYKDMFMNMVITTADRFVTLRMLKVELGRIGDIINQPAEPMLEQRYLGSLQQPFEKISQLALQDVSYSYGSFEDNIVDQVSLMLEPGDKVAIYGPSGCGKSTLLRIISGLYSPIAGSVQVNGHALHHFGYRHFRERISYLSGSEEILEATVLENITFDDADMGLAVDAKRLDHCIEQASLQDCIQTLPNGLNTRIGNSGVKLSSGQRQRLLLARALYRQPDILLLDEPTSHLDSLSRDAIIETLAQLAVTSVIVTHDPALLRICNKAYQMQQGKLVALNTLPVGEDHEAI